MNLLEITPADIERWKKGLRTPELTDRDSEVRKLIGEDHFGFRTESYLKANYQLPAPTEADIIKYLQASEVPPSQWHPAAQEWAKRHDGQVIWEFQTLFTGVWKSAMHVLDRDENFIETHIHRLRADYGKAKVLYGKMEDFPMPIPEPEVCVWEARRKDPPMWYITCSAQASFCKLGGYCPYCGKRIETKP